MICGAAAVAALVPGNPGNMMGSLPWATRQRPVVPVQEPLRPSWPRMAESSSSPRAFSAFSQPQISIDCIDECGIVALGPKVVLIFRGTGQAVI